MATPHSQSVPPNPELNRAQCPQLVFGATTAHPLVSALHQDHINFSHLLDLLQQQHDLLASGADEAVDFYLLLDILEYIDNYPALIHHRCEDVIYQAFVDRTIAGQRLVEPLLEEDKQLTALVRQLRVAVEQILQAGFVPRQDFERRLGEFIEVQRGHIDREEGAVFYEIVQTLTENDWGLIERSLPTIADPLFGRQVQQRYRAIYAGILSLPS